MLLMFGCSSVYCMCISSLFAAGDVCTFGTLSSPIHVPRLHPRLSLLNASDASFSPSHALRHTRMLVPAG